MPTAIKENAAETISHEEELIARARRMVPVLRERAESCEEKRALLDVTLNDFVEAGFFRALQPASHGGYEMHPMVLYKVCMELAKGCPSSAWVAAVIGIHNWEVALLDPRVADDLWSKDDNIRTSSSYAPFGTVECVEGGFRLKGRWPWSSGSDHCQWAILGGRVPTGPDELPDIRAFFVPCKDYVIDDTWFALGLKGTGSKDIVIEDAFVPEYRTHKFLDSFMMQDEGRKTFASRNYRYPFGIIFAYCLSTTALGMADGALETFIGQMRERHGTYDGAAAVDDPAVRQRLAEASTLIRGCHLRLEANFAEMDALIDSGADIPMDVRVRNKWDAQHIAKTAMQATELLFKASGARGIRLSNPLQRYFRDLHAASNHAYLNADKGALNMGGVLMGRDTSDFSL